MIDQIWTVRLWDGFDGEWMDVSEPMTQVAADNLAGDKNAARGGSLEGKREGSYGDIDYYKAFPADTRMIFADGNSQTRGARK